MRVKDIERWQWVLIAIVLGLLIGFVNNMFADERLESISRSINQEQFERALAQRIPLAGGKKVPGITAIHVIPINIRREIHYVVEGKCCDTMSERARLLGRGGKLEWIPSRFPAGRQYTPRIRSKATPVDTRSSLEKLAEKLKLKEPDPSGTVLDFLRKMKAEQGIDFTYDWWKQPRAQMAFWVILMVILVGGIWPFLVSMLAYGTLLPPAKPKPVKQLKEERKYSKPAPPSTPALANKAVLTSADMDQIKALELQLEESLEGFGASSIPSDTPTAPGAPMPVRQLTATGPQASALPQQDKEAKEFDAKPDDFYPVERHTRPKKS